MEAAIGAFCRPLGICVGAKSTHALESPYGDLGTLDLGTQAGYEHEVDTDSPCGERASAQTARVEYPWT